jgi:hypothetical protein
MKFTLLSTNFFLLRNVLRNHVDLSLTHVTIGKEHERANDNAIFSFSVANLFPAHHYTPSEAKRQDGLKERNLFSVANLFFSYQYIPSEAKRHCGLKGTKTHVKYVVTCIICICMTQK